MERRLSNVDVSFYYPVSFIQEHGCSLIRASLLRSLGEVVEGFLRAEYTAHYFNLTVFQEEMLQELISFTIK